MDLSMSLTMAQGFITVENETAVIATVPSALLVMDTISWAENIRDRAYNDLEDEEDSDDADPEYMSHLRAEADRLTAWINQPVITQHPISAASLEFNMRAGLAPHIISNAEDMSSYLTTLLSASVPIEDFEDDISLDFLLSSQREATTLYIDKDKPSLSKIERFRGPHVSVKPVEAPEISKMVAGHLFFGTIEG